MYRVGTKQCRLLSYWVIFTHGVPSCSGYALYNMLLYCYVVQWMVAGIQQLQLEKI